MAFTYKLEHPDGIPADPPTFQSPAGTSWKVGDPHHAVGELSAWSGSATTTPTTRRP